MLDIKKELSQRKFKTTNRLYYWTYKTLMDIAHKRKYNAKYNIIDDVNECKGPCFVIFNHLSRLDHYFVMKACYPKRINMVAGYSEFFRSHLHTVFKMNNIIPKKNYSNDVLATKGILSIIKQGGSVTFSPEGLATNDGLPKPIVPNTGHLFKKCGIPVYFAKLEGQYFLNTKHCLDERYGEVHVTLSKLFTSEDLEKLSVPEIDDKINEAFNHDQFKWQKENHIKWNMRGRPCYNLESMLYECPKCHQLFTNRSNDNEMWCEKCGNRLTVDEYYDLIPIGEDSIVPEITSDWINMQRINVIKAIRNNPEYRFEEDVEIGALPNDHYLKDLKTSEIIGKGKLTIDHQGVKYVDNEKEENNFFLDYKKIFTAITELDSTYINFYVDGEYRDIFPARKTSLFMIVLIEEMHRLHVNYYKNFKWNQYMYE